MSKLWASCAAQFCDMVCSNLKMDIYLQTFMNSIFGWTSFRPAFSEVILL